MGQARQTAASEEGRLNSRSSPYFLSDDSCSRKKIGLSELSVLDERDKGGTNLEHRHTRDLVE